MFKVESSGTRPTAPATPTVLVFRTLTWTASAQNSDGTVLSDLGGYKIKYGQTSGVYDTVIDVGNVLSYEFSSLTGTYYFVILTYDTSGNESDASNELSATF